MFFSSLTCLMTCRYQVLLIHAEMGGATSGRHPRQDNNYNHSLFILFGVLAVARSTFSSLALCSAYRIFCQDVMGSFLWQSRWLWFQYPYFRVEWWCGLWLNAVPYLPVGFDNLPQWDRDFLLEFIDSDLSPVLPRPGNSQWWYSTDTSRQTDTLTLFMASA
jgi:hypothetical protein